MPDGKGGNGVSVDSIIEAVQLGRLSVADAYNQLADMAPAGVTSAPLWASVQIMAFLNPTQQAELQSLVNRDTPGANTALARMATGGPVAGGIGPGVTPQGVTVGAPTITGVGAGTALAPRFAGGPAAGETPSVREEFSPSELFRQFVVQSPMGRSAMGRSAMERLFGPLQTSFLLQGGGGAGTATQVGPGGPAAFSQFLGGGQALRGQGLRNQLQALASWLQGPGGMATAPVGRTPQEQAFAQFFHPSAAGGQERQFEAFLAPFLTTGPIETRRAAQNVFERAFDLWQAQNAENAAANFLPWALQQNLGGIWR